jgi:hypothetical protein
LPPQFCTRPRDASNPGPDFIGSKGVFEKKLRNQGAARKILDFTPARVQ